MERHLRKMLKGGTFKNVSPARSLAMSKIRGRGNLTTEVPLRYAMVKAGISGWRMHPVLPGRPDFFFLPSQSCIFVDGCFWHGCPRCGHIPRTRSQFWRAKIDRNQQRAAKWGPDAEAQRSPSDSRLGVSSKEGFGFCHDQDQCSGEPTRTMTCR